ncbi:prepilin-type N-terminal cleavage/methylation domain-containing protein [Methyloversatilis thermotolerans]|uniref:prepilin-type N-terminal cleavage/methylation domain-containing protein n=1 Tax=Methyloversatilis thermotolerans TaxID=1346290 RepID=UPI00036A9158|nr:PilW family protein [Methyloversatilis thermotolerans]
MKRLGQGGSSLIELMIALAIGLFITAAAISLMLGNRQTYDTTEGLSRIQESARIAFELLARDLREAGLNSCGGARQFVNILNSPSSLWWTQWNGGLRGYGGSDAFSGAAFGSAVGQRATGTSALHIMRSGSQPNTVSSHDTASQTITLSPRNAGLAAGDLAIVCNFSQASLFQVSAAGTNTVAHAPDGSPGNCSRGLGFANPPDCSQNGQTYRYEANAVVMKLESLAWYVGNTGRSSTTSRSLFRVAPQNNAGTLSLVAEEVLDGVIDLQVDYLLEGGSAYVAASAVSDWTSVTGVRLQLVIEEPDRPAAVTDRVRRTLTHVVTLRNRLS